MNYFPHEVIYNIVSQLSPMDCIECYQVSRQWQTFIRPFAASCFRDIKLDDHQDSLKTLAHIHVFGRFVRTVRLKIEELETTIKVLDRLKSCSLLQKFELRNVSTLDTKVLYIKLVSCFRHWKLDTFAIINFQTPKLRMMDYVILLATEYNARHLAFTCEEAIPYEMPKSKLQSSNLSSLVSLVIENPAMNTSNFETLLSYTPNIEYLELSPIYKKNPIMSIIFTMCPKVTHIHLSILGSMEFDDAVYPKDYLQYPAKAVPDDQHYHGLHYYWNSASRLNQAEYDMLLRYQSTLQCVSLGCCYSSRFAPNWETFTKCFLPNTTLRHLVLPLYRRKDRSHLQYEDGYAHWLNACQALEHLELHGVWHPFGESMMHTLEYKLPSLGCIDITLDASIGEEELESELFMNHLKLLQALQYRCNHTDTLKELQICLSGHFAPSNTATILSAILDIRTLEKLTVQANGYYYQLEEQYTLAFIEGLQLNLPRLTHLHLGWQFKVSIHIIYTLATLHRIKSLALIDNHMSMNEAELLITTLGNNLKKLYLVNCGFTTNEETLLRLLAKNYTCDCEIKTNG
ncbi:hypothetical protein K492DRAFT_197351 [Lichtheimia hyalospora FSU 10163]|nr:hypothetical protein K492DRAFT_197351 [Lichtheimia hyalospora FSU 10163]